MRTIFQAPKAMGIVTVTCLLLFLARPTFSQGLSAPKGGAYAGAPSCASCHRAEFDAWNRSGHARIILAPGSVESNGIPLPAGYSAGEVAFIIGGFKWKALFLDSNGYFITSTQAGPGKNQYNVRSRTWVDYRPGERVAYDCGRCHTTGYSRAGHEGGREGIIGTWAFVGVQCEVCHGPGARHSASTLKEDIVRNAKACQDCHATPPLDEIPMDGVFLTPYTTGNQLSGSAMSSLSCSGCHDPHSSGYDSARVSCSLCHRKIADVYQRSRMFQAGVSCVDCHMPPAGIVAEGDPRTYTGDLRSHLFVIDHQADFTTAVKNGRRVSPGYLTVDYSCAPCHHLFESRSWLVVYSSIAHKIRTATILEIFRFQMVLTAAGFLLGVAALLSAASMKGWLGGLADKRRLLRIHRFSGWATFSIFFFMALMCLVFHIPRAGPAGVLFLGWFSFHPIMGVLGLAFYTGKILSVRKYHAGWKLAGILWGIGIFLAWFLVSLTAVLSYLNVLKV